MILAATQFPECSLIQSSASYWCRKPGIISTLPDGHVTRTHQPALSGVASNFGSLIGHPFDNCRSFTAFTIWLLMPDRKLPAPSFGPAKSL